MDPGEVTALQWRTRKLLAERYLAHFVRQAWHVVEPSTPLVWGRHLDAICAHLEAVTKGDIRNLLICVPPGSTKSLTASVLWPAWVWSTKPGTRWLTASNGADLVTRDAVACRRLLESDWYRERWGDAFALTTDQNLKSWYENDKRGFRTAISVGSATTGRKGDILLVDDPDDAKKVRSEVERRNVHEWWDKAFFNRVNNHVTGRRVVIAQRLHPEDLIGHILETGGFEALIIPEEFDPAKRITTSIGWTDWRTESGELLRPERFGPAQVDEAKRRLRGDYHAVHNQNPIPAEGNQFKAEWLRSYAIVDGWYTFEPGSRPVSFEMLRNRFLTVDTAASVKETSKHDPDYTVISAWGLTTFGQLLWLGCRRLRVEVPDIARHVAIEYRKHKATKVYVEAGAQKGAAQLCRRHQFATGVTMNVVEWNTTGKGDKLQRAHHVLCLAEAGRLYLPDNVPDFPLSEVHGELLRFTGDPKVDGHDDIVDTASMAGWIVAGPERPVVKGRGGKVLAAGLNIRLRG